VCTKYEVSIFGHSKDIKGVPKFRKWSRDLSHAHLGVKFSYNIYITPSFNEPATGRLQDARTSDVV